MHITSCLHPKRIKNPYTGELQVVACGHCSACQNRKASIWVQRLNQERYCWKYCWFFTLTYAPDYVPTLRVENNELLVAKDNLHISHSSLVPVINVNDIYCKITDRQEARCRRYLTAHNEIYYVSVYDVQCFMKRLRVTIDRLHKSSKNLLNEKDSKIRYFICSEYGPKGRPCRPHYHGLLFFNSELTAAYIHEIISQVWKFGFVNSSPVSETNSSYVAQYLNCTSHLPKIYEHKQIRPFILFSKCPPIGSLCHSTEEIRKLFDTASPEHIIFDHKKGLFENVPLWRNYQDSLYPRLSYFGELSHSDRITLYRVYEKFSRTYPDCTSAQFYVYCKNALSSLVYNSIPLSTTCVDYMRTLDKVGTPYPFMRWFNISSKVCEQARAFGVSIESYVSTIENFYSNVEKLNIQKQFQFEKDWCERYPVESLIGIDTLFLRSLFDVDLSLLSYEEIQVLQSYNIDFDKFFSDDLGIRNAYYQSLLPENTQDYFNFYLDNESIRRNNSKTKEKNEFINPNIFGEF